MYSRKNSITEHYDKNHQSIEWSGENEDLLAEWCDIAQCYRWLHSQSHYKFSKLHALFTIPTIVFSTVSGTTLFAQLNANAHIQIIIQIIIGSINIFVGVLSTIQQYLKISELNESHRIASLMWDKLIRNIRFELAKSPLERTEASQFLKNSRQEFDRLMENSPNIPPDIINLFKKTFSGEKNSKERKYYDNLKKPDICNYIISINENRIKWFLTNDDDDNVEKNKKKNNSDSDSDSDGDNSSNNGDSNKNKNFNKVIPQYTRQSSIIHNKPRKISIKKQQSVHRKSLLNKNLLEKRSLTYMNTMNEIGKSKQINSEIKKDIKTKQRSFSEYSSDKNSSGNESHENKDDNNYNRSENKSLDAILKLKKTIMNKLYMDDDEDDDDKTENTDKNENNDENV